MLTTLTIIDIIVVSSSSSSGSSSSSSSSIIIILISIVVINVIAKANGGMAGQQTVPEDRRRWLGGRESPILHFPRMTEKTTTTYTNIWALNYIIYIYIYIYI